MDSNRSCRGRLVAVVVANAALIALPALLPPDGQTRADFARFLGRFHPLLVHLPIALLLIVPFLRRRNASHGFAEAASFTLGAGAWTATFSALLGWALAYADGNVGGTVTLHMWGGVVTSIAALLAWTVIDVKPGVYRLSYLTALVGLFATGHWGGQLTHGEDYLLEHAPASLKGLLAGGGGAEELDASTVYGGAVAPALDEHCTQCHNDKKQKGKLRLDSIAAMAKGGEGGAAVVAFKPESSELLKRVTLPHDHEDFMPPDGKPALSAERVELLKWWIASGATETQKIADAKGAPPAVLKLFASTAKKVHQPLVADYSAQFPALQKAAHAVGVRFDPVSKIPSDGLVLRTVDAAKTFGDKELAALSNAAPFVVDAELARTQLTDAGLAALQSFVHLRRLDLSRTKISGAGLKSLAPLGKLEHLNLVGTGVDDATLPALASLKSLQKLYVFESKATTNGAAALQAKLPGAVVDTGAIVAPAVVADATPKGDKKK